MRITTIAIAFLVSAACAKTVKVETDPKGGKADIDVQAPGVPEAWSGILSSVGASGVTGNASGTTANDMSHVTINVSGAHAIYRSQPVMPLRAIRRPASDHTRSASRSLTSAPG